MNTLAAFLAYLFLAYRLVELSHFDKAKNPQ
jgi:hypothetical protein